MLAAELVDFVVDLVSDPDFLVLLGVVEHRAVDLLALQPVHHLDFVEGDQQSVGSAAGHAFHFVCLDHQVHADHFLHAWHSEVEARLDELALQHSPLLYQSYLSLADLVKPEQHGDCVCRHEKADSC